MKIGVLAGAFDPIHEGHIDFIVSSINKYDLGIVFVLIENESIHKKIFASYEDRKKMIEIAINGNKKISIYETSAKTFPISNCLPEIKIQNPKSKIYLLIGSDVAEHITEWDGAKELLKEIELIVAKRGGGAKERLIRSGEIRDRIKNNIKPNGLSPEVLQHIQQNRLYL